VQTDQYSQPAFKDRTLVFIGLSVYMFNLVRAFFKEKKRVWMSKILRIFLRGQPNVPTQEKHVTPVCDAGIFCRKEKTRKEKMKVMQKY
jgi:hypothetical protein